MNLHQLRALRETVRSDFNLTKASRSAGTSQPALSRAILELEAELGVDVLIRHGKRLIGLTEPGKAVFARAERVLAEISGIEQVTADYRARDAGELRIATTHTQARYALPPVVREFRRRYPAVRLSLTQGSPKQLMQSLRDREVDFAIATEVDIAAPDLHVIPAMRWEHVIVVPTKHVLAGKIPELAELARQPIITYVPEFTGRTKIDRAFSEAGFHPDIVLAAIDSDVIKTYVALGLGVGIMAGLAYDATRDKGLSAMSAGHLFGQQQTKIAVLKDHFLRGFALSFLEILAPDSDRKALIR
jgi:LysR family transcriptional regulator, cys regulon transcriptional activator